MINIMDLLFAELKRKANDKKQTLNKNKHYISLKNGLLVLHYPRFISKKMCMKWFAYFQRIKFPDSPKILIFSKQVLIPRQQVAYGDANYEYSGLSVKPLPWTPSLLILKDYVETLSGHTYNFLLINKYRNGKDHISFHKDSDSKLNPTTPIASITFGDTRQFVLKHDNKNIEQIKIMLCDGDILFMYQPTNKHWKHSITKNKSMNIRYNLTFRHIL